MSSALQGLEKELVRRAVFIDMEPGLSRHQYVTTLRWQLRRIYLACLWRLASQEQRRQGRPGLVPAFSFQPYRRMRIGLEQMAQE